MSNNGGAESYPFSSQKRSLEDGGTARGLAHGRVPLSGFFWPAVVFFRRSTREQKVGVRQGRRSSLVYEFYFLSASQTCARVFLEQWFYPCLIHSYRSPAGCPFPAEVSLSSAATLTSVTRDVDRIKRSGVLIRQALALLEIMFGSLWYVSVPHFWKILS